MKLINRGILAMTITAAFTQAAIAVDLESNEQKVSYAIGADMGKTIAQIDQDSSLDLDILLEGIKQAYEGKELAMTQEEMETAMINFAETRIKAVQAEREKAAEENAAQGKAFLDENKGKDGVKTTDSGLQYIVITEGDGAQPSADDDVTVNYEGRLLDGTVFDSSYERGEPVTFNLTDVIPGWIEGLQLMKAGSKYTFFVPAELAYGEQGAGPAIQPNSTLIFDVELLSVNDDADAETDTEATEQTEQTEQK